MSGQLSPGFSGLKLTTCLTFLTLRQVAGEGFAHSRGPHRGDGPSLRSTPRRTSVITVTQTVWTAVRSEGARPDVGPRAAMGQLAHAPRIPPRRRRRPQIYESEWPKQRGNIATDRRLAKPAILTTMTVARPVTLGGGTGRVSKTFEIRPEQSASCCRDHAQASLKEPPILPVEPQSHPDRTRTDIDSSRRRRSVEPALMDTSEVAAMLNRSIRSGQFLPGPGLTDTQRSSTQRLLEITVPRLPRGRFRHASRCSVS
jgi:hypothetical protein